MPIPKQTFSVLNTSGHIIYGPGVALQPGLNEGVSVAAFTKAFLSADGQPTLSSAKHLSPSGDKPPSVLPITVKAVPALPQDFALLAIAGAQPEDRRTLHALLEVETRKPVAEAIRAKLAAMDRAAEPTAVAISQPRPRIHFGDETIARDSGQAFAAEAKATAALAPTRAQEVATPSGVPTFEFVAHGEGQLEQDFLATAMQRTLAAMKPRETLEEARAIPISHQPKSQPQEPAGLIFSGTRESIPEVTGLPGHLGAGWSKDGPGISATGSEAKAPELQQKLSAYGQASTATHEPATTTPEATSENHPAPAAAAPARSEHVPVATPSQPARRARRGQG